MCWWKSRPGAGAAEIAPLVAAARQHKRVVKVGFNHRFHPAIARAKELVDEGSIGPMMFIRGRYGHGGRLGYEKEWRSDPGDFRRRRADRPGLASDRPVALVSGRSHLGLRHCATPISGT